MFEDDAPVGQTLEKGGADVGCTHHFDHAGARDTQHVTQFDQRERQHRQDQHLRVFEGGSLAHEDGGAGQQFQPDGEYQDQENACGKVWSGGGHQATHREDAVQWFAFIEARQQTKHQSQGHDDHEGGGGQENRVLKPSQECVRNRTAGLHGFTRVAAQQAA